MSYTGQKITVRAGGVVLGSETGQSVVLKHDTEIKIQGPWRKIPNTYYFFFNNWKCLVSEELIKALLEEKKATESLHARAKQEPE